MVPYYVRPSEAGVVAHFEAVAAASPAPVVIYNIPVRTGRNLGPGGMLQLAQHPNIAGVKQAVGALDTETLEILAAAPLRLLRARWRRPVPAPHRADGGRGRDLRQRATCAPSASWP